MGGFCRPFVYLRGTNVKDYCTLSPELNHGSCCKQHDIDYTFQLPKLQSDFKFFKCVRNRSGILIALIYYSVVSTLGWYWYLKAKREVIYNVN